MHHSARCDKHCKSNLGVQILHQMIACLNIIISTIQSLQKPCLSVPSPGLATSVPRYSVLPLDFGWLRAYPMKLKEEAHKAMSLMFQHEGVPLLMVMDSSKEQTLGKFCQISLVLAVRRRPQNLTPLRRMLLNGRSRNSRKEPAESCSLSTCPGYSGMIAWNMRLMYDHIWPMTYSN